MPAGHYAGVVGVDNRCGRTVVGRLFVVEEVDDNDKLIGKIEADKQVHYYWLVLVGAHYVADSV